MDYSQWTANAPESQFPPKDEDYMQSIMRIMDLVRTYEQHSILFNNPLLANGGFIKNCEQLVHNGKIIDELRENTLKDSVLSKNVSNSTDSESTEENLNKELYCQEEFSLNFSYDEESASEMLSNKRQRQEDDLLEIKIEKVSIKKESVNSLKKKNENLTQINEKTAKRKKRCNTNQENVNVYSKAYKSKKETKPVSLEFSDEEMKLVNMVNKPRKRGTQERKSVITSQKKVSSSSARKLYIPDRDDEEMQMRERYPNYDKIISKMKKDKYYNFMIQNFPEYYGKVGSFMDNYINQQSRLDNIKILAHKLRFEDTAIFQKQTKQDKFSAKNLWSRHHPQSEVDTFVKEAEAIWPWNDEKGEFVDFRQDKCLELLKSNDFDFEKTKEMIRNKKMKL
jgi:hypothetical protein